MRLLVVDDNELSLELVAEVLAADGHDVTTAATGTAALALVTQRAWDLVLMDLHLPGLSGVEVCRRARAAGVRVPIVALSASAMPDEIARAMPAGFDAYWTKPIAPAALRAAVRRQPIAASDDHAAVPA